MHRLQIKEPKYLNNLVSEHIRNCALNNNPNFSVIPFYRLICETTEQERVKKKENYFIHKQKPVLNDGYA